MEMQRGGSRVLVVAYAITLTFISTVCGENTCYNQAIEIGVHSDSQCSEPVSEDYQSRIQDVIPKTQQEWNSIED